MDKLPSVLFKFYEQLKQRNTGQIVDSGCCGKNVYTFVKGNVLDSGSRCGPCGTKKDHSRVYSCQ